jgi:hypothetical protein
MFVQMRSPFGRWLKIDAEDGSIVEWAMVAWQDIPHLKAIAVTPAPVRKVTAICSIARLPLGLRSPKAVHSTQTHLP